MYINYVIYTHIQYIMLNVIQVKSDVQMEYFTFTYSFLCGNTRMALKASAPFWFDYISTYMRLKLILILLDLALKPQLW